MTMMSISHTFSAFFCFVWAGCLLLTQSRAGKGRVGGRIIMQSDKLTTFQVLVSQGPPIIGVEDLPYTSRNLAQCH